ncbi:hypothetical protein I6N90_01485 [Paenibacillus sp. GSMTC-2017]|uniref:hypothetical protein n=1 Tax=Paenibacillus sp. GSMTC-2017 TaxID=2794350 RepID=UPI0018D6C04A|nr:hypothetical protein [Paenibacillus sp. GSMTC-2017]MBH5316476.1 hypothetical protein [Paenibacillus sp. GSMTC-2017]
MDNPHKSQSAPIENGRLNRKQIRIVIGVLSALLVVSGLLFYFILTSLSGRSPGIEAPLEAIKQYRYSSVEASNGMKLHVLTTKPAFITLEVVNNNVTLTDKVGINGGFFYNDALLSMSVVNSHAVNGEMNGFGSGGQNVKYARGTLVWDGESDGLSVQVVSKASEVKVKDHTRFWAQGGISMSLGNEAGWVQQTKVENAPFPDELRLRSGAVYDDKGTLYLVVSETSGTLEMFRSAIIEKISDSKLVDGIFLDGDGSSQLLSKEKSLSGDDRIVVQMLRIMK